MTSAQAIAVGQGRPRVSRLGGLITTYPLLTVTVVLGAVGLQEFVDLASILNSLRAARARPQTK
ncbi:MAG: hypothetical protein ABI130_10665 [Leifsonia sp.]